MSYTLGTYGATDATGWSTFSGATAIYYVAAPPTGDDTNSGTSVGSPFATISKAYLTAHASHLADGCWILLRQGDTFTDQYLGEASSAGTSDLSGTSTNPFIFGSYNASFPGVVNPATGVARPIIKTPPTLSCVTGTGSGHNVNCAIIGLDMICYGGNPNDSGYCWVLDFTNPGTIGGGTGYSVNDVITLQAVGGTTLQTAVYKVRTVGGGGAVTIADPFETSASNRGIGRFDPNNLPTSFTQASVSPPGGTGFTITSPRWRTAYRDTTGVNAGSGGSFFDFYIIEDCRFQYYYLGTDSASSTGPYALNTNLTVRRNTYAYNYFSGSHGGAAHPWTNDENFYYYNGYDEAGASSSLTHNMYLENSFGATGYKFDPAGYGGQVVVRGNTSIRPSGVDQIRGGGTALDNCFIRIGLCHNFSNFINSNAITNNVYLEGWQGTSASGGATPFEIKPYAGAVPTNVGTGNTVNGNIVCNSVDNTGTSFQFEVGQNNWTASNNIVFNYIKSSILHDSVGSGSTFAFDSTTGCVVGVSIVGGSGYTDLNHATITSLAVDPTQNYIIATVNNADQIRKWCTVYIDGMTGTLAPFLNGLTFQIQGIDGTNQIELYGSSAAGVALNGGASHSGGTIYAPYYQTALLTDSGPGSGATADIIVAGGSVVAVIFAGGEKFAGFGAGGSGPYDNLPGSLYDTTTPSILKVDDATQLGGGGTNFRATVTQIAVNTVDGTNIFDSQGTGSHPTWPHPFANSGTYYNFLFGGSGATYVDYALAGMNNCKNAPWNPALTANNGINPYIRAGFGIGGGVIPPPTVTTGNRWGVLKHRPTKIPHAS